MKRIFEKIGYFLLGGIVATIGYIAGSMDNSVAQQDIGYFRQLHVKESILVGDITSQEQTFIGISSNDKTAAITLVYNRPKDASIEKSDATATIIASESTAQQAYSMLSLTDKSNHDNKLYSYDKPCTAYGFLDHSLKEDCATLTISLKGVSNGETKKIHA